MTSLPISATGTSRRPAQSDRRRLTVKLFLYTLILAIYPTEAWGHALSAIHEAATGAAWLKLIAYHGVVVHHVLQDVKNFMRALCRKSSKCLYLLWYFRRQSRHFEHLLWVEGSTN